MPCSSVDPNLFQTGPNLLSWSKSFWIYLSRRAKFSCFWSGLKSFRPDQMPHPSTVRPRDTRPQAARTSQVHVFELGPKKFEMNEFM